MDENVFKERASVMFGRPSSRNNLNKAQGGASSGGFCSCFDGLVASLMGFPTTNNIEVTSYAEPKPLAPITKCVQWGDLGSERRGGVKHVEVGTGAKECSAGWVNQDATAACAAQQKKAGGDAAGGPTGDGALFFCVFDGHGQSGHDVASICAERLPAHLAAHPGGPLSNPIKALEDAFKKTDDDIYRFMGPRVEYSGSTGVAVVMDPVKRMLYVGNVGDSRCVLGQYSPDAKCPTWTAVALTEDLKPDIPQEQERIELSGGTVMALEGEDGRDVGPARVWESAAREKPGLAVSRSLGDGASRCLGVIADPVVTQHQLQATDRFILIATDGLWDSLGNDQAVRVTAQYLDRNLPHVAIKALMETVRREEGGQLVDDTTMVLVQFG